jgi:hypothetical protein
MTQLKTYDLDGGSSLEASVTATEDSTITIVVNERDADNIAIMLRGAELSWDDREAMTKLAELIDDTRK